MPRRIHWAANATSGRGGRARQLRTREGARATERSPRALLRPKESVHTAVSH